MCSFLVSNLTFYYRSPKETAPLCNLPPVDVAGTSRGFCFSLRAMFVTYFEVTRALAGFFRGFIYSLSSVCASMLSHSGTTGGETALRRSNRKQSVEEAETAGSGGRWKQRIYTYLFSWTAVTFLRVHQQ